MLRKFEDELKTAMKAKDALRVSVLRMLIADIRNERIKLMRDLNDDDYIPIIKRSVKRREEAREEFARGGRQDLSQKEEAEAQILKKYLPAQLGQEEIEKIADEAIAELGAATPKDIGRVMSKIMSAHRAEADGNLVKEIVGKKLAPA